MSYYLDQVGHGQEIVITDRGRPIARISPVRGSEEASSRRNLLILTGRLRPPRAPLDEAFWKRARAADPTGRSLSVLLEERHQSR